MSKIELLDKIIRLNNILLCDMPQYKETAKQFPKDTASQRRLLRSLMNVRPPMPLDAEFLSLQDELLLSEQKEKGVVDVNTLPTYGDLQIVLWQGDITRLNADVIVNAANSKMLGCFYPCHGCIDNAIHSAAGLQLRQECHEQMQKQGHDEPTGRAIITRAYNLPCKYILHTVGPIISGELTVQDSKLLADCYRSCLDVAVERGMKSIAFCCISTGEFCFPNDQAAKIALKTVTDFQNEKPQDEIKVIFNVFKKIDYDIYIELLKAKSTPK